MDYSLPGSSVHGIFQTRVLEWVAISFSRVQKTEEGMKWMLEGTRYIHCILSPYRADGLSRSSRMMGTHQLSVCMNHFSYLRTNKYVAWEFSHSNRMQAVVLLKTLTKQPPYAQNCWPLTLI